MRIQLATPYRLPEIVGGISSYVETLRHALKEAGVDVTVDRKIDSSCDVVHCHAHWYVLKDSLKRRKISGFTFHTIPRLSHLKWKVFSRLLAKCKFLIHLSEYSLHEISNATGLDGLVIRPSVIPETVSEKEIGKLRQELGIGSRYPILCMISPLEFKEKCEGIKSLLASLDMVEVDGEPLLLIVGDGSRMDELRNFAEKHNLQSKVLFLGKVANAWNYLALCDIYTHISFIDNTPLAILEAMSLGKPVISVDVGGIRELLGSEGILTKTSPDQIADAISDMAGSAEKIRKVSETLRDRFDEAFSLRNMAKKHVEVYREAMAGT